MRPATLFHPTSFQLHLPTSSFPHLAVNGRGAMSKKRKRISSCSPTFNNPPQPQTSKSIRGGNLTTRRRLTFSSSPTTSTGVWFPLGVSGTELCLYLTLPTGQTFRWRKTGPTQFTGVVGPYLVSLAQKGPLDPVMFQVHVAPDGVTSAAGARAVLEDYFNLSIRLQGMWAKFANSDRRFAELATLFGGGARVLRQDPVECVFQFLCSSNNNIARIEKMVGVISAYGEYLGTIGGFDFHQFPSLERLKRVTEQELRDAGFGYRAKYIVGSVKALLAKPGGGAKWLGSIRHLELHEVTEALCALPGVGPKVAACIALFSLDQHHAVPVDTHVWKIATKYLLPELAGLKLSPKHSTLVTEAFLARFGAYAGWAQNVFFIGELHSHKTFGEFLKEETTSKDT